MMRSVLLMGVVAVGAACGQDKIAVREGDATDYNHAPIVAAVDKFVAAGRTPDAYGELSQTAFQLRAGMDRTVAKETELKLMVLGLAPVQSVRAKSAAEQIDALALTVWPTLLAPVFESDELITKNDPKAAGTMIKPGEPVRDYLIRLCGGPLAADCKQIVPEMQGMVVGAIAARRATERVRNAVSDCMACGESGWQESVRSWEAIDRMANAAVADLELRADPDNWPTAGSAAEIDPGLPEAEIGVAGEVVIGGQRYSGPQRIPALRDLRGESEAIALHIRPEVSLAQVRTLLGDVRRSGATRVAVIARAAHYPWDRKIYWIADGVGQRADLRPTDSLQLLLHAVDAVAGPGTVARVD